METLICDAPAMTYSFCIPRDMNHPMSENFITICLRNVYTQVKKSQGPFLRSMAHRAAPNSVSIGHASANAVKATAGGWSTGSSASVTWVMSTICQVFGMTRLGLEPKTCRL